MMDESTLLSSRLRPPLQLLMDDCSICVNINRAQALAPYILMPSVTHYRQHHHFCFCKNHSASSKEFFFIVIVNKRTTHLHPHSDVTIHRRHHNQNLFFFFYFCYSHHPNYLLLESPLSHSWILASITSIFLILFQQLCITNWIFVIIVKNSETFSTVDVWSVIFILCYCESLETETLSPSLPLFLLVLELGAPMTKTFLLLLMSSVGDNDYFNDMQIMIRITITVMSRLLTYKTLSTNNRDQEDEKTRKTSKNKGHNHHQLDDLTETSLLLSRSLKTKNCIISQANITATDNNVVIIVDEKKKIRHQDPGRCQSTITLLVVVQKHSKLSKEKNKKNYQHRQVKQPKSTASEIQIFPEMSSSSFSSPCLLSVSSSNNVASTNRPSQHQYFKTNRYRGRSCYYYSCSTSSINNISCSSSCCHHHRILLFSILMFMVISAQILSVSCMLDALKALFILTGASTYLVTKYVNITQQQPLPNAVVGSLGVSNPSITNHSWIMTQWPMFREDHHHLSPPSVSGAPSSHHWPSGDYSTSSSPLSSSQTSPMLLTPGGINFLKGDHQQQATAANGKLSSAQHLASSATIRPIYVLAIEEEEDERQMPKSLLNLSISADHYHNNNHPKQNSNNNLLSGIQVDYILDAKVDDYAQVFKFFALNRSTGELYLVRPLDRDPPNGRSQWRFSIQARNRQTQIILAMADVAITVRDINDNKPLFEQKLYKTTLMENGPAGQVLTKLHAVDFDEADTADNGKILYSLIKTAVGDSKWTTDLFQIDPHTGVLTVLDCCFDREKKSEYRLVARATDAGGLWDEAKIIVSIGDLNDNPPKFLNPSRTLRLDEITDRELYRQGINDHEHHRKQQQPEQDENIFTFYISDEDLPESNHHNYEIVNSTQCPLFKRFYIVINIDGSGTLYGTRRNESELRDHMFQMMATNATNQTVATTSTNAINDMITATCQLDVVVRDSVRDSVTSSGLVYEDHTTLTLFYQFAIAGTKKNNKLTNGSSSTGIVVINNSSNANAVIAFDHFGLAKDVSKLQSGPKASDLSTTGSNRKTFQSNTIGDENNGQCSNGDLCHPQTQQPDEPNGAASSGSVGNNLVETTTFDAFKQWLDWSNNKNFFLYASVIIFINLIILLISATFWLIKQARIRAADPNNNHDYCPSTTIGPIQDLMTTSSVIANNYYQIPLVQQRQQCPPNIDHQQLPPQRYLLDKNTNISISYEFAPTSSPSSIKEDGAYLDVYKCSSSFIEHNPHHHHLHAQIIEDKSSSAIQQQQQSYIT